MSLRAVVFTRRGDLDSVGSVLRRYGWEATEARAEWEVLDRVERRAADLVIIGPSAGYNRSGIALTQAVRDRDPRCPVLLFTEESSEAFAIDALRAGASDLLVDTASQSEIADALGRVAGRQEPEEDAEPLVAGGKLIGTSVPAKSVRMSIARAALSSRFPSRRKPSDLHARAERRRNGPFTTHSRFATTTVRCMGSRPLTSRRVSPFSLTFPVSK